MTTPAPTKPDCRPSAPKIAADVLAALSRAPGTQTQIARLIGIDPNKSTVKRYLDAYRAAGFVYIDRWANCVSPIYAFTPVRHHFRDAPRPEKRRYAD